jgi:hypothetical protein
MGLMLYKSFVELGPIHVLTHAGSSTEIRDSVGTSGYVRIAALGLASQECYEATFRDLGSISQKAVYGTCDHEPDVGLLRTVKPCFSKAGLEAPDRR